MRPTPHLAGPHQRSVWSFPRPPVLEAEPARLRVVFAGRTIAESWAGHKTLETSHPPTYYLPRGDVDAAALRPHPRSSTCEWKGRATYFDVVVGDRTATCAAWAYPQPTPAFAAIAGHLAFYCGAMEACWVGAEQATPQPGGFYGGWVTTSVVGPFKGGPNSAGW